MVFYAHGFTLSDDQLRRIAQGQAIRLKHANLEGSDQIFLTKPQVTKINRAKSAGKGIQLQLSIAQLEHATVEGSGRFTDFIRKLGSMAASVARPAASLLFENVREDVGKAGAKLADHALGAVGSTVKKYVGGDKFVDAGVALGNKHSQAQIEKLLEGISRTITGGCACQAVVGRGLFAPGRS